MNTVRTTDEESAGARKVAVVTGAGSGIGRAVAVELLTAGWSVALAGRRPEPLAETAAAAPAGGGTALTVRADVSRPEDVAALFGAVRDRFGRLDLLFNNAGTFGPGGVPVEDLPTSLAARGGHQPQRGVPVRTGGVPADEGAGPAGRPDHQQRLDLGTHAASALGGVHRDQARADGSDQVTVAGRRPYGIAVGQIDIGNAATEMTAGMQTGALQANGETAPEPVMDVADVARTVRHMAELPLEANVQFATVMATAMPYVGRG